MENAGFLDYRVPVASDVPMIEAVLVEVPNPRHPFGARGVGVPVARPLLDVAAHVLHAEHAGAVDTGRGRRGGSRSSAPLEGTFDHGEEGYGLWLDPAIQDDPVYAEHWAGHRPVEVAVEEDRIVIRRAGDGE